MIMRILATLLILATAVMLFVACSKPIEKMSVDELMVFGEKYLLDLDYDQAIIVFSKILEIDPKNTGAFIGLADSFSAKGDMDTAADWIKKGLEELPESSELQ